MSSTVGSTNTYGAWRSSQFTADDRCVARGGESGCESGRECGCESDREADDEACCGECMVRSLVIVSLAPPIPHHGGAMMRRRW
jgi:hypothetical protein